MSVLLRNGWISAPVYWAYLELHAMFRALTCPRPEEALITQEKYWSIVLGSLEMVVKLLGPMHELVASGPAASQLRQASSELPTCTESMMTAADSETPKGKPAAVAASADRVPEAPVALNGPDDDVYVWGKRKDPLPRAQYRVVKALVDAHANGERPSKDALCRRADVEDPVGALKRLCKRDADWKDAIDMARVPGRGYGLKDKPPTPTQKNRENHPRRPRGG